MRLAFSALVFVALLGTPVGAGAQDPHEVHTVPARQEEPATEKPPAVTQAVEAPNQPIPPISDADRAAAFPIGLRGHPSHDRRIHTFVLFDQLEWQGAGDGGASVDLTSWIGGDRHRLWARAEGESENGAMESAHAHVLYGRSISPWWDLVAGIRQDFQPGPSQMWAAVGIQGLAPYWFDVEATGYVGRDGRTHARLEVEYELLLTNRWILQPLVETDVYGKSDPARGIGAGLSSIETGIRLRYEIRRELAPYIGITWDRKLFGTADFARAEGSDVGTVRVALGLRSWF